MFIIFALTIRASTNSATKSTRKAEKRAKKLRSKTELVPAVEVQRKREAYVAKAKIEAASNPNDVFKPEPFLEGSYDSSGDEREAGEEELNDEIEFAMEVVDEVEEEEIEVNDSMLVSAVRTVEDNAKFYLGRVFGYGSDDDDIKDSNDEATSSADIVHITEEQLDMIAEKISARLESEVRKDFRHRADDIAEEKVESIEVVVAEDEDRHMKPRDIAVDVMAAEKVALEDMKDEIDDAAEKVKEGIEDRAKKIRNDVVEEVTGKKLDIIEEAQKRRKDRKRQQWLKYREMERKQKMAKNMEQVLGSNPAVGAGIRGRGAGAHDDENSDNGGFLKRNEAPMEKKVRTNFNVQTTSSDEDDARQRVEKKDHFSENEAPRDLKMKKRKRVPYENKDE